MTIVHDRSGSQGAPPPRPAPMLLPSQCTRQRLLLGSLDSSASSPVLEATAVVRMPQAAAGNAAGSVVTGFSC